MKTTRKSSTLATRKEAVANPTPSTRREICAESGGELPHRWKSEPLSGPVASLGLLAKSLLFAELSDIAYYREDVVVRLAAAVRLPTVRYLECDGSQAYLLSNETDCVVVCRGTEAHEWNDIKADLNAWTAVAETVGRVHRGFKQEVDDLWPKLEEALVNNAKALWFTGHSLGGAMATICAGRCHLSHIESMPAGLYTYGSPRVGNKRYVNHCHLDHYRWVNNNDIVTRVPPPWFGYRHNGRHMYLDFRGRLRRLSNWQRTKDRWLGFWTGLRSGRLDPFTDHLQSNYIAIIHQALMDESAGKDVLGRADKLSTRLVKRLRKGRRADVPAAADAK